MDRDGILKWLKIFSFAFIILLVLELCDLFLFGNVVITLESEQVTLARFLFSSDFLSLTSPVLYVLLILTSSLFLTLSLFILRLTLKRDMGDNKLSKVILMIGLVLLVGNFVKLEYIYFLNNSSVIATLSTPYTFIQVIYDQTVTPLFGAIMWIYLTAVSATLILSGLIFGAFGLQWFLKLEKEIKKS